VLEERRVQREVAPRRLADAQPREPAIDLRDAAGRGQLDGAERADGVPRVAPIERERDQEVGQGERLPDSLLEDRLSLQRARAR
jgi:hypothetical protein